MTTKPTALLLQIVDGTTVVTDKVLLKLAAEWTAADSLSDEEMETGVITSPWTLKWDARCKKIFGYDRTFKIQSGQHADYEMFDIVKEYYL